ncbi:MAG TPA: 3-hydroxyacyl-CoA dehydrogenase NAD-binding domain-containing protein, partial [Labilithrix sp.]|nr:3-hydroxyacyl-CoA dehydrogenase NAD-binding domain-containing protein [Labilithrix sp.]
MRVTVLGAGYMGSAMAEVAAMRGHDVRLWGTWLDDALVEAVEQGRDHPRLRKKLDARVRPLRSAALAEALDGAELVIHGVSSDGIVPVLTKAAAHLPDVPILSVTKGFLPGKSGKMERVDVIASEVVGRPLRYVHAAGPAKAVEVARRVLTWMFFASADIAHARAAAAAVGGEHLRVTVSDDIAGASICSAMKNAYATGLGLWDGLVGSDCHNARAACFQQAVVEMARLVAAGGGRAETTYAAPGVGDLHVTAAAGRNRAFGERVGKGKPAKTVAAEMLAAGELTEGYPAIASAWRWAK